MEDDKIELRNYLEDLVLENARIIANKLEYCECERCMFDITAIALNDLPPRYVVTREGYLYAKLKLLENEFYVRILTAVNKAAQVVNASPRHSKT